MQNTSTNARSGHDNRTTILCYICEKFERNTTLKKFNESYWNTAVRVANLRKNLTSDKYRIITQKFLNNSDYEIPAGVGYHSSCYRSFTAVKRPRETSPACSEQHHESKISRIITRQCDVLPQYNEEGLLKGTCMFCGKARKKKSGKEEPRQKILTFAGCNMLYERAQLSQNERVKSLLTSGVDLIAKEAEYHKSCRLQFMTETAGLTDINATTANSFREPALLCIFEFIQKEVIEEQRSILMSTLMTMYKTEYIVQGGREEDVIPYTSQNLQKQICQRFGKRVAVKLANQRKGNFIYNSSVKEEDAKNLLQQNGTDGKFKQDELLRNAALYLRSTILQIPNSKTPHPTTIKNLKECAPDIPDQLLLFFRYLLNGTATSCTTSDTNERKVANMASDAIYNVTRGLVKPWKHIVLGLGMSFLTGSKLGLQFLNRAGHCINYNDAKGYETELAYSIDASTLDTPNGIRLHNQLATASAWDNYDVNVETLDGKATLHATVGLTYQNELEDEATTENVTQFALREGKNRRSFKGRERAITPFKKPLGQAKFFCQTNGESYDEHSGALASVAATTPPTTSNQQALSCNLNLKLLDFYWFWSSRDRKLPLHAGFISTYTKDFLPVHRIAYMDTICRSPTDNAVVRETMIRSMNVAEEACQDFAVVTYDLAVAQKAYSIQALEAPRFDKLLILL